MAMASEKDVAVTVTDKTVDQVYHFGKKLGKGAFSFVREVTHLQNQQKFACKVIDKENEEVDEEVMRREIDIMKKLDHNNIVKLYEVYEDSKYIYLILELISGGILFDKIVAKKFFTEKEAVPVVRQILEAVNYMHSKGVAHRDLKPENILLMDKGSDLLKVTDFGLAKDFGGVDAKLSTSCGTPDFAAPEVVKGMPYTAAVDSWSIGVIAYTMLCGFLPFTGDNDYQTFDRILKANYSFPSPEWDNVSDAAKDFLKSIFVLDGAQRPSCDALLKHAWIVNGSTNESNIVNFDKLQKWSESRWQLRQQMGLAGADSTADASN
jgi:calcium/calmodulin-dependent protein kinase I